MRFPPSPYKSGVMLKYYLQEALEPTILFGMFSALLGVAAAAFYVKISIVTAILAVVGVGFAQMSVNVLDDYVDYARGIDSAATRTKFSGGSGFIVDGLLKPSEVLMIGLIAFAIAGIIGIYLILGNPLVIPFAVIGGITILLYAAFFVNIPFVAEPLTIFNFMLIVLGSFVVVSGSLAHMSSVAFVAFAAGVMPGMALFVNETPDRKVDKKFGRKSGAVMLNSNVKSSYYYLGWEAASYIAILTGVLLKAIPYAEAVCFAAIPLMIACFYAIRSYSNAQKFEKYMAANALHSLLFALLLIIGYVIVIF